MSTYWETRGGEIKFDELLKALPELGLRLDKGGLDDEWAGIADAGGNYVVAEADEDGDVCFESRGAGNDPRLMLDVIAARFVVKILSEDDDDFADETPVRATLLRPETGEAIAEIVTVRHLCDGIDADGLCSPDYIISGDEDYDRFVEAGGPTDGGKVRVVLHD